MMPAALTQNIGQSLGLSPWLTVDQVMINAFADLTGDRQYIHVDEQAAARGPFGGTIAHGLLVLSLAPQLIYPLLGALLPAATLVNYGSDKCRYLAPVRAGGKVRAQLRLLGVEPRGHGWLLRCELTMELEGSDKPALIAELLSLYQPATAPSDV